MALTLSQPTAVGDVTTSIRNGQLVINETYEFWLTTDTLPVTNAELAGAAPVPYSNATGLGYCVNTVISRTNNKKLFKVRSTFSSDIGSNGNGGGSLSGDPETFVPTAQLILEPYERIFLKDIYNQPYTNGAGVPFGSGMPRPFDAMRWDFWQFEPAATTYETITSRNESVNQGVYKGKDEATFLLKVRNAVLGFFRGAQRWMIEYSIIEKKHTWIDEVANVGNSFRDNAGNLWPYRYAVYNNGGQFNYQLSQAIHTGPLGQRDVPVNTAFNTQDGQPTGGIVIVNGQPYAQRPATPVIHHIKRLKFPRLDFSTFLRL